MAICGVSDDDEIDWTNAIKHLDDSSHTIWEKISDVAYEIFSILFFPLALLQTAYSKFQVFAANQCLLVSQVEEWKKLKIQQFFNQYWYGEVTPYNQHIRDHYKAEPISAKTPDGVRIEGTFLKHTAANEETPVVMVFQGNGSLSIQNEIAMFADSAIENNNVVNFLIFDYRGVKPDTPLPANASKLVIDAETIYQYARRHFHVETLHIFGFSLGGAVSLIWRSLHPEIEGRCVTDRSFSSSKAVVLEQLPRILNQFIGWLCEAFDWNLESAKAWVDIQAEKLCVYSEEDPIIPFASSLYKMLQEWGAIHETETLRLEVEGYQGANHHSLPPQIYHDQNGKNAWKRICKFLFEPKKDTIERLPPHLIHPSSGVFV